MTPVRFVRSYRMYQPGEVAGFDDALAAQLIKGGFAVDPEAAAQAVAEGGAAEEVAKDETDLAAQAEAENTAVEDPAEDGPEKTAKTKKKG